MERLPEYSILRSGLGHRIASRRSIQAPYFARQGSNDTMRSDSRNYIRTWVFGETRRKPPPAVGEIQPRHYELSPLSV